MARKRPTTRLSALLRKGKFLYMPSLTDPLGGRLAESIGFKSVYTGGYGIGSIAFFRTDFNGVVLGVFTQLVL